MMYQPVRPPSLLRRLLPECHWRIPTDEKQVFLTFDDGPIPGVTEFVLDQLLARNIHATFFCIGKNVRAHPALLQRIRNEGHAIGNHTENHLNGWKVGAQSYLSDVDSASAVITSNWFRPPYGKLTRKKIRELRQRNFQIAMWDVLSCDFDRSVSPEHCLRNVIQFVRPGSIVVFHDSVKAQPNLEFALPHALDTLQEQGYTFGKLDAVSPI